MSTESMGVFLNAYKCMKKSCPKCKKGTAMMSSNNRGWVLSCSKCNYKTQSTDGTLTSAIRQWDDARYDMLHQGEGELPND